jgi:hypothetical protein
MRYPRFGLARTTDRVNRWIRKGKITREEVTRPVVEDEQELDQGTTENVIPPWGYTIGQF